MRELKDIGLVPCRYVLGSKNDADIFTKNVTVAIFEKHIPKCVGVDEYMEEKEVSCADIQRLNTSKQVAYQKAQFGTRKRTYICT